MKMVGTPNSRIETKTQKKGQYSVQNIENSEGSPGNQDTTTSSGIETGSGEDETAIEHPELEQDHYGDAPYQGHFLDYEYQPYLDHEENLDWYYHSSHEHDNQFLE